MQELPGSPRVILLVAVARQQVIGLGNALPWHLPEDLQRFKAITTGHTVAMGRKTFESIVARLGKPLPNRHNIVITRDRHYQPAGVEVIHDTHELAHRPEEKIFVIGGAQVYQACLGSASEIDMTEIDLETPGDAYFPVLDESQWSKSCGDWLHSASGGLTYRFVTYRRRS